MMWTFCLFLLLPTVHAQQPQVVYLWPQGAATLQGANEKETIVPPNAKPGELSGGLRRDGRLADARPDRGPGRRARRIDHAVGEPRPRDEPAVRDGGGDFSAPRATPSRW